MRLRAATFAAVVLAASIAGGWSGSQATDATTDPWAQVPAILARIRPPTFSDRDFVLTDFGARADGRTDATDAFRAAIDACHRAGGGRVVVPAGEFLTGPIHLRSGVDLHVSAGATVRFSRDPARYLPVVLTRWEGVELMNYSPLVYAFEQERIAITGSGTLDGQAGPEHWWPWKASSGPTSQAPDRARLFQQAEDGVPVAERVYGEGHYLRPSFIQPYRCKDVLIEGVTIRNSPMWIVHPVLSSNVTVRGVKVLSHGPNNDGCNPESSSDVLIEDTEFDTGDDCIALKSGRNADGRRIGVPVERVVVRGCRMRAGHGGVTIGSEVSGGARQVYVERCTMSSPDLDRGIRIKTNARRGGIVEDVYVRDVEIGEVGAAVDIDMLYEEGASGTFLPIVRNLRIERLKVARAEYAFRILGLDRSPVRGLLIRDSVFRNVTRGSRLQGIADVRLDNVTLEAAPVPGRR
jgi:polygalacturonase